MKESQHMVFIKAIVKNKLFERDFHSLFGELIQNAYIICVGLNFNVKERFRLFDVLQLYFRNYW